MWLNEKKLTDSAICTYRESLLNSCPNYVVIDGLFNEVKLDEVIKVLNDSSSWQTQKHTYSALYVDNAQWEETTVDERFVKRDVWLREVENSIDVTLNNRSFCLAADFLSFLRGDEFMSLLSRIFNVALTDMNVAEPKINTNYFRLSSTDFVEQHADDSPGREVCMLLYLNKEWNVNAGGELVFLGKNENGIDLAPIYNRCVLFDPSSEGSEHRVKHLNAEFDDVFRYNVTSWYWSE
jgi:SM-20-related protein